MSVFSPFLSFLYSSNISSFIIGCCSSSNRGGISSNLVEVVFDIVLNNHSYTTIVVVEYR